MNPVSEQKELLTTNRKALTVNLDQPKYGTFAEIGAGQEVARWFFQAGGAAGTVAKTISAYDMTFSDAIYGKAPRYVSRERLSLMLDHEYALLNERLAATRGASTDFFVFADTVSAMSYKGNNECHGWMGVRFQTEPNGEPSDIILHVRMWDKENILQQQALGIVGVNLIYGAFYLRDSVDNFIVSLVDNVGTARIEVDMLKFSGPAFHQVDNRLTLAFPRQARPHQCRDVRSRRRGTPTFRGTLQKSDHGRTRQLPSGDACQCRHDQLRLRTVRTRTTRQG